MHNNSQPAPSLSVWQLVVALVRETWRRLSIMNAIALGMYMLCYFWPRIGSNTPPTTWVADTLLNLLFLWLPLLAVTAATNFTNCKSVCAQLEAACECAILNAKSLAKRYKCDDECLRKLTITLQNLAQDVKKAVDARFTYDKRFARYVRNVPFHAHTNGVGQQLQNVHEYTMELFDSHKSREEIPDGRENNVWCWVQQAHALSNMLFAINESTLPPHYVLFTDMVVSLVLIILMPVLWSTYGHYAYPATVVMIAVLAPLATIIKELHPPHLRSGAAAKTASHITDAVSTVGDIVGAPVYIQREPLHQTIITATRHRSPNPAPSSSLNNNFF